VSETEHSFDKINDSLKRATAALREHGVPFVLGGSLASWARGGPETRHDLDFLVKPEDAERALEALEAVGMKPEKPPEEWLYKAWDGDVLVDIIFGPSGLEVDDELIARGEDLHVLGITVPTMALEDLLTTKLWALSEHDLNYSPLLAIVRAVREQIDWPALRARTAGSPFADAFFTLVEALGIAEPDGAAPRAAEEPAAGARVRVLEGPGGRARRAS
jgi:predicted nucleotidyltransferase